MCREGVDVRSFMNDMSMRKKLVLSFIAVMFIPLFVCVYLASSMQDILLNNALTQAEYSAERAKDRIERILITVATVGYGLSHDAGLNKLLFTEYGNDFARVSEHWQNGDYTSYIKSYLYDLDGIHFYVDKKYYVLNTGFIKNTSDAISGTPWYRRASEYPFTPFWEYVNNDSYDKRDAYNLALIRPLFGGGEYLGVLSVYVNAKTLKEIALQESFDALLITGDGLIIMSGDDAYLGKTIDDIGLDLRDGSDSQELIYNNKLTRVIAKQISLPDVAGNFRVLSIFSVDSILSASYSVILTEYLLLALGMMLNVVVWVLLSGLISKRLTQVRSDIRRAAGGDFDFLPQVDGRDEIGELGDNLSLMLANTRDLIAKVYDTQIQQAKLQTKHRDIQLQVLNSQINPHFLFNSLESIRMKVLLQNDDVNAEAIRQLSNLLRKSLGRGSEPIPLIDEVEMVRDYLHLQQFRFGARLQFRIDLLADIDKQTILPFTLQPIVENAVRHGLEQLDGQRSDGYVSVCVETQINRLIIRVADNGLGMKPLTLQSLRENLHSMTEDSPAGHIGIVNVNQRIKLNYGEQYGLSLQSVEGKGTVVTIELPITQD